jgi:hypothetical protein
MAFNIVAVSNLVVSIDKFVVVVEVIPNSVTLNVFTSKGPHFIHAVN